MEGDVALSPSPTGTHTSLAQGILRLRNDFDSGMISDEAAGISCLLSHFVPQGIGHPTPREAARSGTTFLPTPRALFRGDPSKLAPPVVEGSIQPGTSVTASKVMHLCCLGLGAGRVLVWFVQIISPLLTSSTQMTPMGRAQSL